MKQITVEQIKQDLETAAYVERLMPPVRPPKYRSCMPDIIYILRKKLHLWTGDL